MTMQWRIQKDYIHIRNVDDIFNNGKSSETIQFGNSPTKTPSVTQNPGTILSFNPSSCVDEPGWTTYDPAGQWPGRTTHILVFLQLRGVLIFHCTGIRVKIPMRHVVSVEEVTIYQ